MRGAVLAVLACLAAAGAPSTAAPKVYLTRPDALRLCFGDSLTVATRTAYLDERQIERVRQLAKAPFEAARVTYYEGVGADSLPRLYGYIDTHVVRTMKETVLIVLDREGRARAVEVLSFDEPEDYLAPPRWRERFRGRGLSATLRPGADLPHLSGATLTARVLAEAVRRAQAIHALLYGSAVSRGAAGGGGGR